MWASLFTALEAWNKTAKLLEQAGEAYIMWRVAKIRSDHEAINGARDEIIRGINLARSQRDRVKLINFNRALYLLEHGERLQHKQDQSAESGPVRST